jgi:hypothetical protein
MRLYLQEQQISRAKQGKGKKNGGANAELSFTPHYEFEIK